MGENAIHHLQDKVRANQQNPGFVTHMCESLIERTLLSVTGLVNISPLLFDSREGCLGEQRSIITDDVTLTSV